MVFWSEIVSVIQRGALYRTGTETKYIKLNTKTPFVWGTVCWVGIKIEASRDLYFSVGHFAPPSSCILKLTKKPASFRVKKKILDNNNESLILQDEWTVLELIGGGGWTPIWGRNNIFCLCVCHILKLCSIWLPRWKACQRKKSYWWSCKRFHALWILANYSHMFDWDNFIIHTTNHIWLCLFGIIYFCFFDWFPSNVFAYSTLYSTHLYILLWFSC